MTKKQLMCRINAHKLVEY